MKGSAVNLQPAENDSNVANLVSGAKFELPLLRIEALAKYFPS